MQKVSRNADLHVMPARSPIHDIKEVKDAVGLSARIIRRRLMRLEELGLADYKRGKFTIKSEVVSQPHHVLRSIIP
ncbi:MAG: hypothetical protein F4010_07725, partial [Cenarchaeum sp. SB0669_bin_11]|nr:hypothetical protein [Cenarchaeum sp. SB0669_bin_11]